MPLSRSEATIVGPTSSLITTLINYANLLILLPTVSSTAINLFAELGSYDTETTNYCNDSSLMESAGLLKAPLGQFLGFDCSEEFYHCRWQSDGYRTYKKQCKPGLVYDVLGTQNCNYDYNVKTCGISRGAMACNGTDFLCSLSEQCIPLSMRCDAHYDCTLEEDEQNCPLCTAGEFACIVSEQCIPIDRRCNGRIDCDDGTDERECDMCGHGLFHCAKSDECIPVDERCDGKRQCPHGEDEMLCKKPDQDKKFTCQSKDYQILMTQVCDGVANCPDQSDEIYCELGAAVGAGLSFSSNPIPGAPISSPIIVPQPQPAIPLAKESEEYEYEEEETTEAVLSPKPASPSFPMLSLPNLPVRTKLPSPSIRGPKRPSPSSHATTPPAVPPPAPASQAPITVVSQALPKPSRPTFSKPKPKIAQPDTKLQQQVVVEQPSSQQKHIIVQPTYVEVTAKTPQVKSTTTQPVPVKVKETVAQPEVAPKYSTRPAGGDEIVKPVGAPAGVRPRNQKTIQMYSKAHQKLEAPGSSTEKAFIVEVTAPPRGTQAGLPKTGQMAQVQFVPQAAIALPYPAITQPPLPPPFVQAAVTSPSIARMKNRIITQLGSQFTEGISPELIAKIERMLAAELNPGSAPALRRRKPSNQ